MPWRFGDLFHSANCHISALNRRVVKLADKSQLVAIATTKVAWGRGGRNQILSCFQQTYNRLWPEAAAILAGINKGLNHVSVDEVAIELIQLR